jgi:hypothetical protein
MRRIIGADRFNRPLEVFGHVRAPVPAPLLAMAVVRNPSQKRSARRGLAQAANLKAAIY